MDFTKFETMVMVMVTFLLYLNMPAFAEEYFISPDGDDNNSGNLANPFRTFEKTVKEVQAGDTVFIRGGGYKERLNVSSSGQSGAYLNI